MALKIILESNAIRKIADSDNDLADIRFYVPADSEFIYIAKFDTQIVPLVETSELHNRYKIYKLGNLGNAFTATELSMICMSNDFTTISTTNTEQIDVVNHKYITENAALVSSIASANIQDIYSKIIEMTKLNIKIHDEIKGVE